MRELRKLRGLTLDQLAELSGIRRRTLVNYESGRTLPSIVAAAAIARVFAVSLDELAGMEWSHPDLRLNCNGREYESWLVKGRARSSGPSLEVRSPRVEPAEEPAEERARRS